MDIHNLFNQTRGELAPGITFSGGAGEHLMVTHLHFEEGAVGAIHEHPHEQLTLVLQGEVDFTLDNERQRLKAGDVVAIPSHTLHGVKALTQATLLDIFTPIREDLMKQLRELVQIQKITAAPDSENCAS